MAISVAQRISGFSSSSVSARTLTFGSAVTVGSSIIVICAVNTQEPSTVTDNKGNTYARDARILTGGNGISIWRSSNIATGGSNFTVTATLAGSGTRRITFAAVEVAANILLDKFATKNATSNNPNVLVAPLQGTEEFGIAGFAAGTTQTAITNFPSAWTQIISTFGGNTFLVSQLIDRVVSDWGGNASVSWTMSQSRAWAAGIATYREFVAPAVPVQPDDQYKPKLVGVCPGGLLFPGQPMWSVGLIREGYPGQPEAAAEEGAAKQIFLPRYLEGEKARTERAGRVAALMLNSLVRQKQLHRIAENRFGVRGRGFVEQEDPTVDSDESIGASVGSVWVNNSGDEPTVFVCADNTLGAAVWAQVNVLSTIEPEGGLTGNFPS